MATTVLPLEVDARGDERSFVFESAGWDLYDRLDAWAGERRGVKLVYIDGDVVVVAKSRRHNWFALRPEDVVWSLARSAGVACEDAGETTFRLRERDAGAEADQSYFFGENAARMAGPKNVEPGTDPMPDLMVEVEVGHAVDHSLDAWIRLGVPEVWHLDASSDNLRLRIRRLAPDGASLAVSTRSAFLPASDEQVLELLRLAVVEGTPVWQANLPGRVAR